MSRLNGKLALNDHSRSFIRHYVTTYGHVPLWVLANDLTFGNVVHFYQLMKPGERNEVAKIIARRSGRDVARRGVLTARRLLRATKLLNSYRNICAHDERLYCASVNGDHLSTLFPMIRDVLSEDDALGYVGGIARLWRTYNGRMGLVSLDGLLSDMGFNVTVDGGGAITLDVPQG